MSLELDMSPIIKEKQLSLVDRDFFETTKTIFNTYDKERASDVFVKCRCLFYIYVSYIFINK